MPALPPSPAPSPSCPGERFSPPAAVPAGVNPEELLRAALAAAVHAYAPYSGWQVGAVALDEQRRIFVGCNVENASYGLTICAERSAVFTAVAAGAGRMEAIAVASARARPCWPCGACLQVLAEFADSACTVVLQQADGEPLVLSLSDLLPRPFPPFAGPRP